MADRLCADGDGRVRHLHGRGAGQRAGVQPVHVGCAAHRPQKASLYSFAEPVTAAIISTLVLGSPFTLWDALGFGCIFLMLVLLSLPAKQKN
ncbi:DMT family transporter [Gemmiger formicilis]|uniref:DMT family transporter n=1 Tax=Gemmiger formicilis TaxID=745368 RepID=UPI0035201362